LNKKKQTIIDLLQLADITINGPKNYDIQVSDDAFYQRILKDPSMQMGETYMDGLWNVERLDLMIDKLLRARLGWKIRKNKRLAFRILMAKVFNLQSSSRAFDVGEKHYDIGNDLYKAMLDKRMVYTCAYFKGTEDLEAAQEAKLDMVCRKLDLKPGQKILDIGCGWGSFMKFAAEKYGVEAVGLTVSREQVALGTERCSGLPVKLLLEDYRDHRGSYDHIVSLGMFEHVGYKNYREYMQLVHSCLKEDGCFLLHTIGLNYSVVKGGSWLSKYIFPGAMIPSLTQITKAVEKLFIVEDVHNFGPDYAKTLMAWYLNFEENWPHLKDQYDERFYRMWKYYLLSSVGNFRSRDAQVWQLLLAKGKNVQGYESIRRI
jgi:cyclopropane-fatty-acyl-phospholipid synthase